MLKLNVIINEINENDCDFQRHIFVFCNVLTKYHEVNLRSCLLVFQLARHVSSL
jgi:hypothetical protein